jgi:hypothetical protein
MKEITAYDSRYHAVPQAIKSVFSAPRFRSMEELDRCYAVLISGGGSMGSNHVRYWKTFPLYT